MLFSKTPFKRESHETDNSNILIETIIVIRYRLTNFRTDANHIKALLFKTFSAIKIDLIIERY